MLIELSQNQFVHQQVICQVKILIIIEIVVSNAVHSR